MANIASNWLIGKQEATRHGTSHPSIVPYESFKTQGMSIKIYKLTIINNIYLIFLLLDGYMLIGAGNEKQFKIFCRVLGHEEWSSDLDFINNTSRVKNRVRLVELLTSALTKKPTSEWIKHFTGQGVPFAPINNIQQTFEHPQAIARKVVSQVNHPRSGQMNVLSPAITYNGQKMPVSCWFNYRCGNCYR